MLQRKESVVISRRKGQGNKKVVRVRVRGNGGDLTMAIHLGCPGTRRERNYRSTEDMVWSISGYGVTGDFQGGCEQNPRLGDVCFGGWTGMGTGTTNDGIIHEENGTVRL